MGYILTAAPSTEPLSLAEAKVHLRVGNVDGSGTHPDDNLITALIVAGRQFAEQETQRSLITQSWRYTCDCFPGYQLISDTPWGREFSIPASAICLTKGPISAIGSITYIDMAGSQQTMPSTDYVAELTGPLARITPVFGKIWPIPLPQIGSVAVNFTAGYGNAAAVPQGIKQWMLLRIGALYSFREEIVAERSIKVDPMPFIDCLLDPYRILVA